MENDIEVLNGLLALVEDNLRTIQSGIMDTVDDPELEQVDWSLPYSLKQYWQIEGCFDACYATADESERFTVLRDIVEQSCQKYCIDRFLNAATEGWVSVWVGKELELHGSLHADSWLEQIYTEIQIGGAVGSHSFRMVINFEVNPLEVNKSTGTYTNVCAIRLLPREGATIDEPSTWAVEEQVQFWDLVVHETEMEITRRWNLVEGEGYEAEE